MLLRRLSIASLTLILAFSLAAILVVGAASANTAPQGRYASLILDSDTEEILHARQIDAPRYPASLTKIMTLYMTFEALEQGRFRLDTPLPVSKTAARTPPVKMGLKAGQTVSVDILIQAIAVRSSNDAAVVLAEAMAGSEAAFAEQMTRKARELGMQKTVFKTANGLPHPDQTTTARDMAKLAQATLKRFPQHYHYFGQAEFRGRKNTNGLLARRADVDGFKTGFTRASGYNLALSAKRDGRRLIAIVLGGASKTTRDRHMDDLIDRGFEVMAQTPAPRPPALAEVAPSPAPTSGPAQILTLRRNGALARVQTAGTPVAAAPLWAVQIDGVDSPAEAAILSDRLIRRAGQGQAVPRSGFRAGRAVHHIRVEGLSHARARALCGEHAELLSLPARRCMVLSLANPR